MVEENIFDIRYGRASEWIYKKTNNIGADIFFECVGNNESVFLGINVVGAGGQICLVGNPYSDIKLTKEEYWKILRKQLRLLRKAPRMFPPLILHLESLSPGFCLLQWWPV